MNFCACPKPSYALVRTTRETSTASGEMLLARTGPDDGLDRLAGFGEGRLGRGCHPGDADFRHSPVGLSSQDGGTVDIGSDRMLNRLIRGPGHPSPHLT